MSVLSRSVDFSSTLVTDRQRAAVFSSSTREGAQQARGSKLCCSVGLVDGRGRYIKRTSSMHFKTSARRL